MKKKKILVIGSGGREHALLWKLAQTGKYDLYVAPGNAGTSHIALNVSIKDIPLLLKFAKNIGIDLTIVGPDDPLALGIVDVFQKVGLKIFGPTKSAARIEWSKVFAKEMMQHVGIPTAPFETYCVYTEALEAVRERFSISENLTLVIKADGLALGKGVEICNSFINAQKALEDIMVKKVHGKAGDYVVVEEFIPGTEISVHAFCDGRTFKVFPFSRDHKTLNEEVNAPNTGGMGTISPVPYKAESLVHDIVGMILDGLSQQGSAFSGLLYPGLMNSICGLSVLECNARFGDPEAQVYMRLLKTDLGEIIEACVEQRLNEIDIEWNSGHAACVAMVSEGYPSPNYEKGRLITGISEAEKIPGVVVFHGGTKYEGSKLVTAGGRVVYVTALRATMKEAIDTAYAGVRCINFDGAFFRNDIGAKSLALA